MGEESFSGKNIKISKSFSTLLWTLATLIYHVVLRVRDSLNLCYFFCNAQQKDSLTLSEQKVKVKDGAAPLPINSSLHVKKAVSAEVFAGGKVCRSTIEVLFSASSMPCVPPSCTIATFF